MAETGPVRGVESLNRAFQLAGSGLQADLRLRLRGYARPVEIDAEVNGLSIGSGVEWSRMRTVAGRHSVYVAPQARGTRVPARKRPRFARRMLDRAMVPALNANRESIARNIDGLVGRMERRWSRG